jgi:DNA polymerase-3 subunit beta
MSVGFNVNYLLEAINVIAAENVILGLTDERGSALMRGVDEDLAKFVIMPMNL